MCQNNFKIYIVIPEIDITPNKPDTKEAKFLQRDFFLQIFGIKKKIDDKRMKTKRIIEDEQKLKIKNKT